MTRAFPSGLVTFAFTDVEGSTRLFERIPNEWPALQARQRSIVTKHALAHDGVVVHSHGDGTLLAFTSADHAVAACLAAQRELTTAEWPTAAPVRVRMGVHTGMAEPVENDYVAYAVHEASRVMDCAHGGQIVMSAAAADAVRKWPEGSSVLDLGQHRLRDLPGLWRLSQLAHRDLPRAFPRLRTVAAGPHNLPDATDFVGRVGEIEAISELLRMRRLVTLTGVGGVGKTRLAVEVARSAGSRFPDGVWLIQLAGRTGPGEVTRALAEVLEVMAEPNRDLIDSVEARLRGCAALLVVDNCEHLIDDAAGTIDALLRRCPDIRVLATSRESLRTPDEQVRQITGLRYDADADEPSDAAKLFLRRAAQRHPGKTVPGETGAIDDICRQVEGHALSIELVAGLADRFTPAELAGSLHTFFADPDAMRRRGGATRQATLHNAVSWSYELLSEPQRQLLAELSVFADGWTRRAAGQVCTTRDVAENLDALVAKSVVSAELDNRQQVRYRLLLPVRSFAAGKLAAQASLVRDRHTSWCQELARAADSTVEGSAVELAAFGELEREHANLLAALNYLESTDEATARDMCAALGRFWTVRGHWHVGCERLERLFGSQAELRSAVAPQCLRYLGLMRIRRGARDSGIAALRVAVRLADERDQRDLAAAVRTDLGEQLQRESSWDEAAALRADAEQVAAATPSNHLLRAKCLELAGDQAWRAGDGERARSLLLDALAEYEAGGHRLLRTSALTSLANFASNSQRYDEAAVLYGQANELARESGDVHAEIITLINVANLIHERGDFDSARERYDAALELARSRFDLPSQAYVTGMLALLDWDEGNLANARVLFEQATAVSKECEDPAATANWAAASAAVSAHIRDRWGALLRLRQVVGSDALGGDQQLIAEVAGVAAAALILDGHSPVDAAQLLRIGHAMRIDPPRPGERALLRRTVDEVAARMPGFRLEEAFDGSDGDAISAIRRALWDTLGSSR